MSVVVLGDGAFLLHVVILMGFDFDDVFLEVVLRFPVPMIIVLQSNHTSIVIQEH